jgi:hypothetical protein
MVIPADPVLEPKHMSVEASRYHLRRHAVLPLLFALAACGVTDSEATAQAPRQSRIDAEPMFAAVEYLASDALQGRRAGTPGNAAARRYIVDAFREIGLEPPAGGFEQVFPLRGAASGATGVNVVGMVRGSNEPERYLVVTAHYDHLGVQNGQIFNGADDNASGTGALLALARYFKQNPPAHSIVFAAMDAEEQGLQGARAFVANPPVPRAGIVMNVNMDMVGRSSRNELYAAGTYHYRFLEPYVTRAASSAPLRLLTGHDRPGLPPGDDWTQSSDHGPFHSAGIPFLYFGVEDHPDYHRPTDTADRIDRNFYHRAVETILDVILQLDRDLGAIASR